VTRKEILNTFERKVLRNISGPIEVGQFGGKNKTKN
jgi:hypothetical protein